MNEQHLVTISFPEGYFKIKRQRSFTDSNSDDPVRNWWNDIWYVGRGYSILCYVDPYFLCNGI